MIHHDVVRAMSAEQIRAERKRLEAAIDTARVHLSQMLAALPLAEERERELDREARLMSVRSFRILGTDMNCCASGRDSRGAFWVGVGPVGKLLASYEYVRAGRYGNKRSGRTMGRPLGSSAGAELEVALDRIYGDA